MRNAKSSVPNRITKATVVRNVQTNIRKVKMNQANTRYNEHAGKAIGAE